MQTICLYSYVNIATLCNNNDTIVLNSNNNNGRCVALCGRCKIADFDIRRRYLILKRNNAIVKILFDSSFRSYIFNNCKCTVQ